MRVCYNVRKWVHTPTITHFDLIFSLLAGEGVLDLCDALEDDEADDDEEEDLLLSGDLDLDLFISSSLESEE